MKILVAVLNWGLGHASRSIPIIRALEEEGFEPVLASDGEALMFLREELPHLQWIKLPSYGIIYPENGRLMKLHFLLRGPKIFKAIIGEHRLIRNYIAKEISVGGIISDNRLGAFSKEIPSAYVTHQLKVFSGSTTFWTTRAHQYFINKFTECWIPDLEGHENLSGEMSHGVEIKRPRKFLGLLSRFRKSEGEKKYELLVLLSGPEPQRSMLEAKLLKELKNFPGNILFVRGRLQGGALPSQPEGMEVKNYLTGKALEKALRSTELVVARSGYSTIMDLAVLGKKAFFIPTPGQFEQEFLAARLQKNNIAPFCSQEAFNLKELEKVYAFTGFSVPFFRGAVAGVFTLFKGE